MINMSLLHQYAVDKIYKILMWDIIGEQIETYDEKPYPFYCLLDKNNMDINKCFLVNEKLCNAMANDVSFNCYISKKGSCEITELNMFANFKREHPDMIPYVLCGEYNSDISFFSKVALINIKEFCAACSSGLIKIDTSFTQKSSYIKDDVLYGVAKKTTDNDTFVSFDIGYLSKISSKIVEYQYGFLTARQRDNMFFASNEQVESIANLIKQNKLIPSRDIHLMSFKEAGALLGLLNSESINNEEVQKLIQNKVLIQVLCKYFG